MDSNESMEANGQYEPPLVESVLTADELAREIKYAGDDGASPAAAG